MNYAAEPICKIINGFTRMPTACCCKVKGCTGFVGATPNELAEHYARLEEAAQEEADAASSAASSSVEESTLSEHRAPSLKTMPLSTPKRDFFCFFCAGRKTCL